MESGAGRRGVYDLSRRSAFPVGVIKKAVFPIDGTLAM